MPQQTRTGIRSARHGRGEGHAHQAYAGKIVVLYFYPKDNTPGCTTEAMQFRDKYKDFVKAGAVVFGVSRDNMASHEEFKAKLELPFELIADTEEKLCHMFGVVKNKIMYGKKVKGIERSTFLIGGDGMLEQEWRGLKVPGHVEEVLKAVKALKKAGLSSRSPVSPARSGIGTRSAVRLTADLHRQLRGCLLLTESLRCPCPSRPDQARRLPAPAGSLRAPARSRTGPRNQGAPRPSPRPSRSPRHCSSCRTKARCRRRPGLAATAQAITASRRRPARDGRVRSARSKKTRGDGPRRPCSCSTRTCSCTTR